MAGHRKWSKVKRLKGALDVKRGRIFAKLAKEIMIAAKIGGGDPSNFEKVHKAIESKGIKIESAEATSLAALTVPLVDADAIAAVHKLVEALEENEDVKEVHSNAEFSD